jgi:predicted peroxiredoxin
MKKKKEKAKKTRFVLGKDLTEDQMLEAILRMAKEAGVKLVDDRKKRE